MKLQTTNLQTIRGNAGKAAEGDSGAQRQALGDPTVAQKQISGWLGQVGQSNTDVQVALTGRYNTWTFSTASGRGTYNPENGGIEFTQNRR
jgi:hypothetical protein